MSTNSYVIPNDMSDLCRVCLQLPEESQYLDLTTIYDEEDNLTYGECFTICTEIDLSAGEGIPHYLCKSCGLELQMSYDFYKKIEESKRVIEQFQRQIKAQKVNSAVKTKTLKLDGCGKRPRVEVINEKFIIIDDEEHLPVHTEDAEEECVIQPAPSNVNVERDEIDVNMCDTEANAHHQVPSHQNSSTVETINRKDAKVDVEDQLEIEDYQNLETLEEEETRRKLLTNTQIKKETLNDDENIKPKNQFKAITQAQALASPDIVEIKKEILNENNNKNANALVDNINEGTNLSEANKNIDDLKIENEIVGEYILTCPTELQDLNAPVPTQLLCNLSSPNVQLEGQRFEAFFNCEFCGHRLKTKNALYKHRKRKHKYEKGFCQSTMPLCCPLCPRVFQTTLLLRKHVDAKHSNKKFVCEHCGYNLPTKNALCQHRLRKHRDVEKDKNKGLNFRCPLCSESFITDQQLSLHKASSHYKKKRIITEDTTWFQCEDCGHKMPSKNALSQHRLRKHRNKK